MLEQGRKWNDLWRHLHLIVVRFSLPSVNVTLKIQGTKEKVMGSKLKHRQLSEKYGNKRVPRNMEVQRLIVENKGGPHGDKRDRRQAQNDRRYEEFAESEE